MKFGNLLGDFEILPFPILLLDSDLRVLDWSEQAYSAFGYQKDEALSLNLSDIVSRNINRDFDKLKLLIDEADSDQYEEFMCECSSKAGELLICKWKFKALYDSSNIRHTILIASDVDKSNSPSQEKVIYEALISQTPVMISIFKDLKALFTNKAFTSFADGLLSNENKDLKELLTFIDAEDHLSQILNLNNNESYTFDVQIKHHTKKNNLHVSCFNITLDDNVHHAVVLDDYTDVYKINESMDQTKNLLKDLDVLASLGTMTAGLMHEINNPLSYLASNIEFLRTIFPKLKIESSEDIKEEIVETFDDIEIAISQILEIIRNIKGFVSFDDQNTFLVAEEIQSVLKLAKNDYKYDCEIVHNLDKKLTLKGSSVKFRQIIFNLLSNSIYAIKEKNESSKLFIEISVKKLNGNTEITFKDYGIGIESSRIDDIFRVFSTNKPKGVGTGLGLSLIREFIEEDFHGTISVSSEFGSYSEFRMLLPLHNELSDDETLINSINCWEYMNCGREFGGQNTESLGVCSVLINDALDGTHNGKQAGRCCWIVAGTLCNGTIQGSYASKRESCRNCEFYKLVKTQEKNKIKSQSELLRLIREDYFEE